MATPTRYSFAVSIFWLIAAPAIVVLTLLVWRNVWATFALYHLGTCLVVPLVDRRLIQRDSWPEVGAYLGLCGPDLRAGVRTGALLGLVMAAGTVLFFELGGGSLLDRTAIQEALSGWGVTPSQTKALILVMVLGNGMAEELFWRGWIHRRLASWRPRFGAHLVAAFFYTTYHVATVSLLVDDVRVVVLFMLTILAAGLIWAWLRERFGNVWPALLSHMGATLGYMAVYGLLVVH